MLDFLFCMVTSFHIRCMYRHYLSIVYVCFLKSCINCRIEFSTNNHQNTRSMVNLEDSMKMYLISRYNLVDCASPSILLFFFAFNKSKNNLPSLLLSLKIILSCYRFMRAQSPQLLIIQGGSANVVPQVINISSDGLEFEITILQLVTRLQLIIYVQLHKQKYFIVFIKHYYEIYFLVFYRDVQIYV